METKFYKCPHCGNVIGKIIDSKNEFVGEEVCLLFE